MLSMEHIIRGYVFRIYPEPSQIRLIEQGFGTSRFIYNYFLEKSIQEQQMNYHKYVEELEKTKIKYPWLQEMDHNIPKNALQDLYKGYKNCYYQNNRIPKFKSKNRSKISYRTNHSQKSNGKRNEPIKVDLTIRKIHLPRVGEVSFKGYRSLTRFPGKILNATIYKEAGKYYTSLCVEELITIKPITPTKAIGIDVGIKDLVVTSDGKIYLNPHQIKKYEKKIKGLQKWLSRSKTGSKNQYKIKLKIAKVYQKLKNARKYYLHSISKELTEENDIITTETLKIKKMVQNKNLSKKIYDAAWQELIRQLKYKSKWKGKRFYQVEASYPSSQICNHCNYRERKVKDLKIRTWECPKCKSQNDRDLNASINIMYKGVTMYMDELQVK